ncbi:hypothetical protein I4F81_000806 [Pyropia yezoensis]|uniref:Uncharacterized protein n=1 Tax=Pyropia yezoensis TaxID=2788 RepID=A0ACC3BJS0_PYRYE|nr:hypothetical protein I4F81_000806 [Neopyropia yezoensis]
MAASPPLYLSHTRLHLTGEHPPALAAVRRAAAASGALLLPRLTAAVTHLVVLTADNPPAPDGPSSSAAAAAAAAAVPHHHPDGPPPPPPPPTAAVAAAIRAAVAAGIPVVRPAWLAACVAARGALPAGDYSAVAPRRPPPPPPTPTPLPAGSGATTTIAAAAAAAADRVAAKLRSAGATVLATPSGGSGVPAAGAATHAVCPAALDSRSAAVLGALRSAADGRRAPPPVAVTEAWLDELLWDAAFAARAEARGAAPRAGELTVVEPPPSATAARCPPFAPMPGRFEPAYPLRRSVLARAVVLLGGTVEVKTLSRRAGVTVLVADERAAGTRRKAEAVAGWGVAVVTGGWVLATFAARSRQPEAAYALGGGTRPSAAGA